MTKRMRLTALITIAVLAAGSLAMAAGPGRRGGRHGGEMRGMARALDLTAEQRQQILDIRTRHWNAGLGDAIKDLREAEVAVRRAIHDANATDDQVAAAERASSDKHVRVAVLRHRMALDIDKVLTPEQREKHRQLQAQREERGERRMGARDGFFGAGAED